MCMLHPPRHPLPQCPRPVALGTHSHRPRRLPHRPRRCGTGGRLHPRVWRDAVRSFSTAWRWRRRQKWGGQRGDIRLSARRCRRRGTGHRRHRHGGAGSGGNGGSGGGGGGGGSGRWLAWMERMASAMDGVGAFSSFESAAGRRCSTADAGGGGGRLKGGTSVLVRGWRPPLAGTALHSSREAPDRGKRRTEWGCG